MPQATPLCDDENWPEYLFEYYHEGKAWSFKIPARSPEDAQERVNRLPYAKYLGELKMEIPVRMGWFARLACAVRNLLL